VLRAMRSFPEEAIPPDGKLPRWPWLFAIFGPITTGSRFGMPQLPLSFAFFANYAVTVLFVITMLIVLTQNYRRANPYGRRQLRWVVYGFYLGALPVFLVDAAALYRPQVWPLHDLATTALVFIPLSVFIAIIRSNLFDIDRLISVTAS